jgi:hypothetical protein
MFKTAVYKIKPSRIEPTFYLLYRGAHLLGYMAPNPRWVRMSDKWIMEILPSGETRFFLDGLEGLHALWDARQQAWESYHNCEALQNAAIAKARRRP